MNEFAFKALSGELTKIGNVHSLPRMLFLNTAFSRETLVTGQSHRCVRYTTLRQSDLDTEPVVLPPRWALMTDDELSVIRMMLESILRDVETEVISRREYKKIVSSEMAGITGQDQAGPTGKEK